MADAMYTPAKESFLTGDFTLASQNIKCLLVDSADYTYSVAHQFHSDITGAGIVATSGNFASKTLTSGVFDAADITLSAVSGDQSEYIIIYADSGVSGTSRLMVKLDSYTGLPVTPNGGNITIQWPSDSARIFSL